MIHAAQLKAMPANHDFARGEIEIPDLSPNPLKWVARWTGRDWMIKCAPAHHSFKDVFDRGKIVDVEKYIKTIQPCSPDAYNLYYR